MHNFQGSGSTSEWTHCAAEDERCNFSGFAQVRYGTAGRYVYRDAANGVPCRNNYFGGDPYPGKVEPCEIKR